MSGIHLLDMKWADNIANYYTSDQRAEVEGPVVDSFVGPWQRTGALLVGVSGLV